VGHNARVDAERHPAYLYDLLAEPIAYASAVELQQTLAAARSQGAVPDTVILCEHPATLTLGRSTVAAEELPLGLDAYRALGWDVHESERGGRSTWHGPGQLVCYPILDLRDHGRDLRRYAHDLERVAVGTLGALGIAGAVAGVDAEHVGVWVGGRKIASLGVRVEQWVSTHGIAINVDCDLSAFTRFNPCGLAGAEFTSVAAELGRPVPVAELREPLLDQLAEVFDLRLDPVPAVA
jgi:lipoate-protein ligase B